MIGALVSVLVTFGLTLTPPAGATFPGTNGRIYFKQGRNLYSIGPTGGDKQVLAKGRYFPGKPALKDVAASPNGKKVAFSTTYGIWVGNLETDKAKEITETAADSMTLTVLRYPAWSPNGKKLVFQALKSQGGIVYARLYTINVDGSGIRQVVRFNDFFGNYATNPDWSSQGKIAYTGGVSDLWTINPDGSGKTNVTQDGGTYEDPSWNPNGTQIAVRHETEEASIFEQPGIFSVDAATGNVTAITGHTEHHQHFSNPSWSPDGTQVAFSGFTDSGVSDVQDIYTVPAAGGTPTDLNAAPGSDIDSVEPSWAPAVAP
jgi:Tol biopolymer transport system component